jgi:hypothetical protein
MHRKEGKEKWFANAEHGIKEKLRDEDQSFDSLGSSGIVACSH